MSVGIFNNTFDENALPLSQHISTNQEPEGFLLFTGSLVVNILVFDLRVQLQHCTYQRKTLLLLESRLVLSYVKWKFQASVPLENSPKLST